MDELRRVVSLVQQGRARLDFGVTVGDLHLLAVCRQHARLVLVEVHRTPRHHDDVRQRRTPQLDLDRHARAHALGQLAERQHERELFRHLTIELRSLNQDPQRFFEPLKRLSLHVAEQLVRGELQISGHVIDTLIKQCLEQFDHPADKAVVTLNPADLQRLREMEPSVTQGLELEPDPLLHVGSVKVRVNDTVVQDLIEHRLEPLVRRLLNQPEAWINRSALLNKDKLDVSEVSLPARDWGRPLPDVQDTEIKPVTPPASTHEFEPGSDPKEDSDGL